MFHFERAWFSGNSFVYFVETNGYSVIILSTEDNRTKIILYHTDDSRANVTLFVRDGSIWFGFSYNCPVPIIILQQSLKENKKKKIIEQTFEMYS